MTLTKAFSFALCAAIMFGCAPTGGKMPVALSGTVNLSYSPPGIPAVFSIDSNLQLTVKAGVVKIPTPVGVFELSASARLKAADKKTLVVIRRENEPYSVVYEMDEVNGITFESPYLVVGVECASRNRIELVIAAQPLGAQRGEIGLVVDAKPQVLQSNPPKLMQDYRGVEPEKPSAFVSESPTPPAAPHGAEWRGNSAVTLNFESEPKAPESERPVTPRQTQNPRPVIAAKDLSRKANPHAGSRAVEVVNPRTGVDRTLNLWLPAGLAKVDEKRHRIKIQYPNQKIIIGFKRNGSMQVAYR